MSATKELDFTDEKNKSLPWVTEFNQKLTVLLLKIRDRVDISEEDYDLLRALHKFWYNGEFVIEKTKVRMTDETALQGGLFDTDVAKDPTMLHIKDVSDDLAQ